ncbi:MAG: HAD family phosphatase [Chloroflexota bacterium]|nr:MAG: HAD family phosphatase [Chloroflexota bacterium]
MTIKAIIFDFGEVLNRSVDRQEVASRRAEVAARLGVPLDELWSYLFDRESSEKWMTGQLTWDEFWTEVLAPHGITDLAEIRDFARWVLPKTERLNPDMVQLLGELKGRFSLAILSNATWREEQMGKMFHNDLELPEDTFDVIVTSSSAGVVKPHPEIFRRVLAKLGVRPEEAIFTDDMPQFTAAAASLGIHSHTFTSPAEFRDYLATFGIVTGKPISD